MFKEMILNPLEEAQWYKRLINEFSYDQEKVANLLERVEPYNQLFKTSYITRRCN